MTHQTPRRERRSARLNLTVSAIALVSGMIGASAVATPAAAQCVENPANTHTCSGQTDTPIVIVGGTGPAVYTTPGFGVDTSDNGNGAALTISGTGLVSYTDTDDSLLVGGGMFMEATGADGDLYAFSTGSIIANGAAGLRMHNAGGEDTSVVWYGTIANTGGHGVDVDSEAGSDALTLIFHNTVTGRDDGIHAVFEGNGFIDFKLDGAVIGQSGTGVSIESLGGTGDGIRLRTTDVFGGTYGINVVNQGGGFTQVISTGSVTGAVEDGVRVSTGAGTTGMDIAVNEVTSEEVAILARNFGGGDTTITATGQVTSTGSFAIQGFNANANSHDLTITAVNVSGHSSIVATNNGTGATRVTSTGLLSAYGQEGVRIETAATTTDVFVDIHNAEAAESGVWVTNLGSGVTDVRATGFVSGQYQRGLWVETGSGASDVRIEAVDVRGRSSGISIENDGQGSSTVTATGTVEATSDTGAGIRINTGANTTNVSVTAATVSGGQGGLAVNNGGTGETFIRSTERVSGGEFGILANNGLNTTSLAIRTVDVESGVDGIWAQNLGSGGTSILSTGSILAPGSGVVVQAGLASGDVYIDANNVGGGELGIGIANEGNGTNTVITRGLVEGSIYAMFIHSYGTQDTYIYNDGMIRNSSALSSDLAMRISGGYVEINNSGQLLGTIDSYAEESLIANGGVWNSTGGMSEFTGSNDRLVNGGLIVARSDAATLDTTTWAGLEVFENAAALTLRDGGAGDIVQTSADSVFSEGSTLGVDIGGANGADMFFTGGTLELQEGSQLSVDVVGPLTLNTQYVVAAAFEGLTGEFVFDDVMLTAFAGLRDGYTDQTAYIEFVQLKALAEAGITPNQKEAAAGADSLPDGNPLKDALLMLPTEEAAIDAFDQLSGEVHPTARTAMAEDSRLPRDAVLDRLSDGRAEGAVWGRIIADDGVSFGDFNAARTDRNTHGLVMGADRAIGDNLTAGVAFGWTSTDLEVERRTSAAEVESVQALAYVGGRFGRWGVRAGVGYSEASIETARAVAFPGFSAALDSDYDGSVLQGFMEAGYRIPAAGGHAEPFVNLIALRSETDAFAEATGPAALAGEAIKEDVAMSTLGVRFETNVMGGFSIGGVAGWRHAWGDLDPEGVHAFDGGAPFTVLGAARSDDAAVANLEARWRLGSNVSLKLGLDSVQGTDSSDYAVTGGLKVVF